MQDILEMQIQQSRHGKVFTVARETVALNGAGIFKTVAPGTRVQIAGEGFNQRTVRALLNGVIYFFYLRDLDQVLDATGELCE